MSESSASTALAVPVLSVSERRLLGVLVEKAKTTPDIYPMSLNALVTGSNQKSNREPLLNLTDLDVEDALTTAQQKGLVTRIQGGRVEKWKHNLYEVLHVNKVELAVLTELLLRGPQTEGELRGRASRMEPIADLEALRGVLRPLAERRLVVFLGPEGRRGTLITHGFHAPAELQALHSAVPVEADMPIPPLAPAAPSGNRGQPTERDAELASLRAELAECRTQIQCLQDSVSSLTGQLHDLKKALGA
ncbi:MAG: DUF480 domain-containing protein [Planctomycetes bacterium]|nr:DUF480 domain-containing protein [Planctomycetota bacterium]